MTNKRHTVHMATACAVLSLLFWAFGNAMLVALPYAVWLSALIMVVALTRAGSPATDPPHAASRSRADHAVSDRPSLRR